MTLFIIINDKAVVAAWEASRVVSCFLLLLCVCSFQLSPKPRTSRSDLTHCTCTPTRRRHSATTVGRCCGGSSDRASNVKVRMWKQDASKRPGGDFNSPGVALWWVCAYHLQSHQSWIKWLYSAWSTLNRSVGGGVHLRCIQTAIEAFQCVQIEYSIELQIRWMNIIASAVCGFRSHAAQFQFIHFV